MSRERQSTIPSFPFPRALPWVLGALSVAALGHGWYWDQEAATTLGVVGLVLTVLVFPVAGWLLGREGTDEAGE